MWSKLPSLLQVIASLEACSTLRLRRVQKPRRNAVGLPRGSTIPLSPERRFMCDLMHASRQVPLVAIERSMPLGELVAARNGAERKPSWFALFLKAWALVAENRAALRQSYLTFPWPR